MINKSRIWFSSLLIMGLFLIFTNSCKKDEDNRPTVLDIEGNVYHTVTIGTQVWMVENLKTTKFNDGSAIPLVTDGTAWVNLKTPGYCWYKNDSITNKTTYGALYNWYTVNTGKLCPTGWHVPNDAEWNTLKDYLIANGYNYDGTTTGNKCAKALASNSGWLPYKMVGEDKMRIGSVGNTDYSSKRNATGFTALPGGFRDAFSKGSFLGPLGDIGEWWSSSEEYRVAGSFRILTYEIYLDDSFANFKYGLSVRCLKD